MSANEIRPAVPDDIAAICRFGEEHIPPLYTPLIGAEAARSDAGRGRERTDRRRRQRGRRVRGIGPRLIAALTAQMDTDRVHIEHFVQNERAGKFYEREGFQVERIEQGIVWRSRPVTRP